MTQRSLKQEFNQNKVEFFIGVVVVALIALPLIFLAEGIKRPQPKLLYPIPHPMKPETHIATPSATIEPTDNDSPQNFITPTATPSATKGGIVQQGTASYYSTSGCLGCGQNMTMANGQPLNDNNLTIADNNLALGTLVTVENVATGAAVQATVTDRGGFSALGRIADLSLAVKNAIGCSSMCEVAISL